MGTGDAGVEHHGPVLEAQQAEEEAAGVGGSMGRWGCWVEWVRTIRRLLGVVEGGEW